MVRTYEYKILWTSVRKLWYSFGDTSDKEGKTLLVTQVTVSELMTETNKNTRNKAHPTASEIIPSKNQTLYIITLYHTTNTVLVQGSQKSIRANNEFPVLKAVFLH